MKKSKAIMLTALFLVALVLLGFAFRDNPVDRNDIPIIPAIMSSIFIVAGLAWIVIGFYKLLFRNGLSNDDRLENLKWFPLPKILEEYEAGTFRINTKDGMAQVTFVISINNDIKLAVFLDNFYSREYRKILEDMGYKFYIEEEPKKKTEG